MRKTKSFCNSPERPTLPKSCNSIIYVPSSIGDYIKEGKLENVKLMLITNEVEKNYKDKKGNSLLHLGIFAKQFNICKYLVENRICDINEENIWNMTPLEQAIHLQTYNTNNKELIKIIKLLQENKAYYKFHVDSEQIIFGKRTEYFEKLKFILDNLSYIFQHSKIIQFYHNTYNSPFLFPFSTNVCKSPSLMRYTSNLLFENNYHIFQTRRLCINSFKNQNELFIYPFCKLNNIKYIYTLPLKMDGILLGYFVIWTVEDEPFSDLNFDSLLNSIMNEKYFDILSISPKIYQLNIHHNLILEYTQKIIKKIKGRMIHPTYLKETFNFLNKIQDFHLEHDSTFQSLMNIAQFYKKILIPFGNVRPLYQLVDTISFENNFNDDSFPLVELFKYQLDLSKNIEYNLSKPKKMELSTFDFYSILGYSIDNDKQEKLNYILNNTTDFFNFNIYSTVNSILTGNKDIRTTNVFGTGYQPIMFVFPEEIKKALNFIFSQSYPLLYKYFYIFTTITQYIHPFKDGNGRTSRMILNFSLQKVGIQNIISRNNKLLSFTDYVKLFH